MITCKVKLNCNQYTEAQNYKVQVRSVGQIKKINLFEFQSLEYLH